MITWNELVIAEPRLLQLEEQVRAEAVHAEADPNWSFSIYWSCDLRPALRPLVGWDRRSDARADIPVNLHTEEAWHSAISHLIGLLPEGEGAWAS